MNQVNAGLVLLLIAGGIAFLVLLWAVVTVNRFVRLKHLIRESWSNVDVNLRRRYDLIPNLVNTVKGYAAHERELLEQIARLREAAVASRGPVHEQAEDETRLVHGVNQLLARVEAYPELKASRNFLALQDELVNTEDRIAAARRFYNANVREHNLLREQFPTAIIGNLMGRASADYFEVEALAIRQAPTVSLS